MNYSCLFYYIFCLWSFSYGYSDIELGFFDPSPIEIEEGQRSNAIFSLNGQWPLEYENDIINCKVSKSSKTAPLLVTPLSFNINKGSPQQTIAIIVKEDNDCRDDRPYVGIEVKCSIGLENLVISKYNGVYFSIKDTTVGDICNKHRIKQYVKGVNSDGREVYEQICYDIYGENGDIFEFITDSLLGISAYFEIREEYHVGRIFIITRQGSIEITRDLISGPEDFYATWDDIKKIEIGKDYHLTIDLNKNLHISIQDEGRSLILLVAKDKNSFEKSHLRMSVKETLPNINNIDEFQGGLLGSAANNDYQFYHTNQERKETTAKIKINELEFKSKLEKFFEDDYCFLLKAEDVLYPMPLSLFIRSE